MGEDITNNKGKLFVSVASCPLCLVLWCPTIPAVVGSPWLAARPPPSRCLLSRTGGENKMEKLVS